MLKLIIYGVLFYFAYRFFIKPWFEPKEELPRRDEPDRISGRGTRFSKEEGEFIDYEELDK